MNETLMIMAGMISASVNVYMLRDNSLEAKNESFNIRIRGIGTFCIISGEDATLVIQDTNSKYFHIKNYVMLIHNWLTELLVLPVKCNLVKYCQVA